VSEHTDLAIVGGGAAGLMAGIFAARTLRRLGQVRRIVVLDGAKKLGAKILVAGGGRCNVTHDVVDETAFAGSSRNAIRKVLRRFEVAQTIEFFRQLGVELKREETGKLFPVSDDARSVLGALLEAVREAAVGLRHPARVEQMSSLRPKAPGAGGFRLTGEFGELSADRVIIATGGKSLPKTGSDGHGYAIARSLGHNITPLVLPGLVSLVLEESCFLRRLSGLSAAATLELRSASGKRMISFTDSTLCTHFGLSGPSVLDISRYYLHAVADDTGAALYVNWLPGETIESLEQRLIESAGCPGKLAVGRLLGERLPQRLAGALCEHVGADPATPVQALSRQLRRAVASAATGLRLPVTGDRGFTQAEVTAGGVPLKELRLETMESRLCPGLYLCGEICDVDGRIGGFNFQWAWASGYVAGTAAAAAMAAPSPTGSS
jgi:predicted Rossmann fold flavoprotein